MIYIALLVIAYLGFGARHGLVLGVSFLVAMYSNGLLKDLFNTLRPFQIDPSVLRVPAAVDTAGGAGFPSGHAQSATSFWGVAAVFLRRDWFTVLAFLLIALIGISRLYLGVHMPIDVVVGTLLGLVMVVLAPALLRSEIGYSKGVQVILAFCLPLLFHLVLPTDNSGMLLGGLSGFLLAPLLHRQNLRRNLSTRVLVTTVGLGCVFAALLGSSALLPEAVKASPLGSYFRYLVIALIGLVGVPLLFRDRQ